LIREYSSKIHLHKHNKMQDEEKIEEKVKNDQKYALEKRIK
jgi:hypothetical protein